MQSEHGLIKRPKDEIAYQLALVIHGLSRLLLSGGTVLERIPVQRVEVRRCRRRRYDAGVMVW